MQVKTDESKNEGELFSADRERLCGKRGVKFPPKTWEIFSLELEENGTVGQLVGSKSEEYGEYSSASHAGWPPRGRSGTP